MATANASSGAQFPKPAYNSGYGSAGYDALSQSAQDYTKSAYPGTGVGQQSKGQNVSNPPPTATGSDITSSMYGKSHVALNKVNVSEQFLQTGKLSRFSRFIFFFSFPVQYLVV